MSGCTVAGLGTLWWVWVYCGRFEVYCVGSRTGCTGTVMGLGVLRWDGVYCGLWCARVCWVGLGVLRWSGCPLVYLGVLR